MADQGFPSQHTTTTIMTATSTSVQTDLPYDPLYLSTLPGMLKVAQIALRFLGFMSITFSGNRGYSRAKFFDSISGMAFWFSGFLLEVLLPALKQASVANSSLPIGTSRAAIINVSSILGSIAENNQGGFYPYRTSKAALNAVTRSLSLDLKADQILVMSLHPGWIKTDMGGSQAPLTIDTAIPTIVQLMGSLNESHNGGFYQYDGKKLPW